MFKNKNIIEKGKTTDVKKFFKPLWFPDALKGWTLQQQMHWIPSEINLLNDLNEFINKLTPDEKRIITMTFRFFTQMDVEVGRAYLEYYIPIFKCIEIRMMLIAFANMETIHMEGYAYLISSLRLPDSEFTEFLQYKEMVDKYDYMQSFKTDSPTDIALTLAVFSGGIEGFVLFSSFAILMYFSARRSVSCLSGMGQVVSLSIRDEALHNEFMSRLFHVYLEENKEFINKIELEKAVHENFKILFEHESAFIDLIMQDSTLEGLTKYELKEFIKNLANKRLQKLKFKPIFHVEDPNACNWFNLFMNLPESANFFETTPTAYGNGVTNTDGIENVFDDFNLINT